MTCYICGREPRDEEDKFANVGSISTEHDNDLFCCDDCIDDHMDAMEGVFTEHQTPPT